MDQNPINPQPAPAPAPQPQPAPAPQPVAPEQPIAPISMNLTPEKDPKGKRSKTILLVSLISALVIAAIVAVVLVVLNVVRRNDPQTVAFDAVSNLMKTGQTPTIVSGSINISLPADTSKDDQAEITPYLSAYGFKGLTLNFNTDTQVSSSKSNVELALELADGSQLVLKLGETTISDGKIYISFSGLGEAVDNYFDSLGISIDDLAAVEEYAAIANLYNLIDFAENEWWEISIPDLVDEYSDIFGDDGKKVSDAYACSLAAVNSFASNPDDFISVYDQNRFLSITETGVEKSGTTTYSISLDADTLISFYNSAKDTPIAREYKDCLSAAGVEAKDEDISADLRSLADNLPALETEINLDHRFSRFTFSQKSGDASIDTDIHLSYPAGVSISAPEQYRPISDLFTEILSVLDF